MRWATAIWRRLRDDQKLNLFTISRAEHFKIRSPTLRLTLSIYAYCVANLNLKEVLRCGPEVGLVVRCKTLFRETIKVAATGVVYIDILADR